MYLRGQKLEMCAKYNVLNWNTTSNIAYSGCTIVKKKRGLDFLQHTDVLKFLGAGLTEKRKWSRLETD